MTSLFRTLCVLSFGAGLLAAADPAAPSLVRLSKESLSHAQVRLEPLVRGEWPEVLHMTGRLVLNRNRTARLGSTLEGRLLRLDVDVDDPVKAGQVIGLVQSPELLGRPLELKAPCDGRLVERKAVVGELVTRETDLCVISDTQSLWLLAEVRETDIAALRTGEPVRFTTPAFKQERFLGQVDLLGVEVEPEGRTLEVRIQVANTERRLRPGMHADVEIEVARRAGVLSVPLVALQRMEEGPVVFVLKEEGVFERRLVRTGEEREGRVELLEGVKEGEQVVTDGAFLLRSELQKGELGEEG